MFPSRVSTHAHSSLSARARALRPRHPLLVVRSTPSKSSGASTPSVATSAPVESAPLIGRDDVEEESAPSTPTTSEPSTPAPDASPEPSASVQAPEAPKAPEASSPPAAAPEPSASASEAAPSAVAPSSPPLEQKEAAEAKEDEPLTFLIEASTSVSKFSREEWDACATSGRELNPFLLHEFFMAVEESGSACREEGWQPYHIKITTNDKLAAIIPLYIKFHSYGEYVFDQSWAKFSVQALKQPYYPKAQVCVPFTPVPGSRVLIHPDFLSRQDEVRRAAAQAVASVANELGLSSSHITFLTEEEADAFESVGYQKRVGIQYHFYNQSSKGEKYADFEEFLADLKQSKRKNVRQEMKSVEKEGLKLVRLRGDEMSPAQWDHFHQLYLSTVEKKWGSAYLTRDFFQRLREGDLAKRVMVIGAVEQGEPLGAKPFVGAALNLVGSHALFGRNWGCTREVKNLHFAVCYYDAIKYMIENKMDRVEAGAQGEHKISRGYLPRLTYSVHYLRDPKLRMAVGNFLDQEAEDIKLTRDMINAEVSPFKDMRV